MPKGRRSLLEKQSVPDTVAAALIQMQQVPGFDHVQFVILYGSAAEGRMTANSDIDLCMYYEGDRAEAAHFRHKLLSALPFKHFDIQVFQHLPLYVRVEVLRGTPVFTRNSTFLYEKATETIRDFEDFKHRLYDYTGQAAIR